MNINMNVIRSGSFSQSNYLVYCISSYYFPPSVLLFSSLFHFSCTLNREMQLSCFCLSFFCLIPLNTNTHYFSLLSMCDHNACKYTISSSSHGKRRSVTLRSSFICLPVLPQSCPHNQEPELISTPASASCVLAHVEQML